MTMRQLAPTALAMLFAALCVFPAYAQQMIAGRSVVEVAEQLKPGEFLWVPQIAPEGPVLLIVSTATQRAVLFRNGVPIAVTTVSTGRPGYRTPVGEYVILEKRVRHFSSIYDDAPMPYMQRLTWRGVALHGGQLPGYPASHGCIRLPQDFARLLFDATRLGTTVIVTNEPAVPRLAPGRDPLPDGSEGGDSSWSPERQPMGPITIVISAADGRIVVLRNGRVIGQARAAIDGPVVGTRAYVLGTGGADGRWSRIDLPGDTANTVAAVQDLSWQAIEMSDVFRNRLFQTVVPGTTVIVTSDSLKSGAPAVAWFGEMSAVHGQASHLTR